MINTRQIFEDISSSRNYKFSFGRLYNQILDTHNLSSDEQNFPFYLFIDEIKGGIESSNPIKSESVTVRFMLFKIMDNHDISDSNKYDTYIYPCKLEMKAILNIIGCQNYNVSNFSFNDAYDSQDLSFSGIYGEFTLTSI